MAADLLWLDQNWFNLIQTFGIVGGLWFTAMTLRQQAQASKNTDLLTLAGQHRELWSEVHRRSDLNRVLHADVDLVAAPITVAEEEFLNTVIQHFNTSWVLARTGVAITTKTLAVDARSFFALPLPRTIFERTKAARDPKFVRFIEAACTNQRPWWQFWRQPLGP